MNPPKLTVTVIYCILQMHSPMHYKNLHFERKTHAKVMMAWKSRGKKALVFDDSHSLRKFSTSV